MNSDYKSQAQTLIAEGMLDYYLTVKRLETQAVEATWHALRYQEGWMYIGWDARAGDPVSVTEAEPSEEGESRSPWSSTRATSSPACSCRATSPAT